MAIIIPSKNIYKMENAKINKNIVEAVEVSSKKPSIQIKNGENVSSKKFGTLYIGGSEKKNSEPNTNGSYITTPEADQTFYFGVIAFTEYRDLKHFRLDGHSIEILRENAYIQGLSLGNNDNGEPNIGFSVFGKVRRGVCRGYVEAGFSSGKLSVDTTALQNSLVFESPNFEQEQSYTMPKKVYAEISRDFAVGTKTASSETELPNNNLSSVTASEGIRDFVLSNMSIPCGGTLISVTSGNEYAQIESENTGNEEWYFEGTYEIYDPKYVEISVNGTIVSLALEDENKRIGNNNSKNVVSFSSNELMQTTNKFFEGEPFVSYDLNLKIIGDGCYTESGDYVGSVSCDYDSEYNVYIFNVKNAKSGLGLSNATMIYTPAIATVYYGNDAYSSSYWKFTSIGDLTVTVKEHKQVYDESFIQGEKTLSMLFSADFPVEEILAIDSMFSETIDQYQKGKETATLLCSISDYYEENGEKVISSDKSTGRMTFDLYDEVVPQVLSANGEDIPMSTKEGRAKRFMVLGITPIYDGAVWQEIYLQEI